MRYYIQYLTLPAQAANHVESQVEISKRYLVQTCSFSSTPTTFLGITPPLRTCFAKTCYYSNHGLLSNAAIIADMVVAFPPCDKYSTLLARFFQNYQSFGDSSHVRFHSHNNPRRYSRSLIFHHHVLFHGLHPSNFFNTSVYCAQQFYSKTE